MEALRLCSLLLVSFELVVAICAQSTVEQSDDGSSGTIKFSTPDLHDDEAHSPWMPEQLRCDACKAVTYQLYQKFHAYNEKRKSLKYKIPESEILDMFESTCENSKTWDGYGIKEIKPNKEHRLVGDGIPDINQPGVIAGGGKWPGRYGMKVVQKAHRLSGAGMEVQDVPGITAGGGKWPMSYGVKKIKQVPHLAGEGLDTYNVPGITASGGKWAVRLQDMCEQYAGELGELSIYNQYKKKPKTKQALEDYLCRGQGLRGDCITVDPISKDEL